MNNVTLDHATDGRSGSFRQFGGHVDIKGKTSLRAKRSNLRRCGGQRPRLLRRKQPRLAMTILPSRQGIGNVIASGAKQSPPLWWSEAEIASAQSPAPRNDDSPPGRAQEKSLRAKRSNLRDSGRYSIRMRGRAKASQFQESDCLASSSYYLASAVPAVTFRGSRQLGGGACGACGRLSL